MLVYSLSPNTSRNDSMFGSCFDLQSVMLIDAVVNVIKVLLIVPLAVFILYLAYQRWKQQGSLAAASHCDVFTYHLAVMELSAVFATVFLLLGYYSEFKVMMKVSYCFLSVPYSGQSFFHVLTSVERYLAVVHPHTYIGLKTARGIRIRNITIGCVWLLCFAWMAMSAVVYPNLPVYLALTIMVLWLAVVFFCSLSVLFVLIRSRPGERRGGKGGIDKSKQRAFLTITAILVFFCLWVAGFITVLLLNISASKGYSAGCVMIQIFVWINIPSSLLLPLMYLQRSGKLSFCRHADEKR